MERRDSIMTGEINYFRKRFIGGFNRQDVVDYVAKLAKERNALRAERDKAVQDAGVLANEVAALRLELEEARRSTNESKLEALQSASRTFTELENAFEALRGEIDKTAADVCEELDLARGAIASVPRVLDRAGERFSELHAALDEEMDALRAPVAVVAQVAVYTAESVDEEPTIEVPVSEPGVFEFFPFQGR